MALGEPKGNRRLLFLPEGFAPCLLSGLSSFYCSYILSFLLLDFNRKESHKSRRTFHTAGFLKMVLDAAPVVYAAPALADRSRRLPSADNGSGRERAENVLPDALSVRAYMLESGVPQAALADASVSASFRNCGAIVSNADLSNRRYLRPVSSCAPNFL